MRKLACIFILTLCFTTDVFAASFDCKKANTNTEKMVCSDENLSRLDEELNKVYKQALSAEASKVEVS